MISLRDFSGSSDGRMPAASSSGSVSSKMRPLDRAMVITAGGETYIKQDFSVRPPIFVKGWTERKATDLANRSHGSHLCHGDANRNETTPATTTTAQICCVTLISFGCSVPHI